MGKVLGFTEDYTACDCCGKTDLKGTYAVQDDTQGLIHYGTTCVKRNLGITAKEVTSQINDHKQELKSKARDMFITLGGADISERMSEMEAFTPEHDALYEKVMKIRELIFNELGVRP